MGWGVPCRVALAGWLDQAQAGHISKHVGAALGGMAEAGLGQGPGTYTLVAG